MRSDFEQLAAELELRARGEDIRALKKDIEAALSKAEAAGADPAIIDRLDGMLISLTEASRENVCSNTKCPHYNKKCKMR